MPYTNEDPPDRIKGLPSHAQEIWISAFNSSLDKNGEERAHRVAWAAVKSAGYSQDSGSAKESLIMNFGSISEAEFNSDDRIISNAILIRSGESKNRFYYPPDILKRDGSQVFEGVRAYIGHVDTDFERSNPRNLGGIIKNVRFVDSDSTLRGDIHYFSDSDSIIEKAREAKAKGEDDLLGLSIQTNGSGKLAKRDGKLFRHVMSLVRGNTTSVDFVVGPAAGGRIFESIMEDTFTMDWEKMTLEELKTARPDICELLAKESDTAITVDMLKEKHPEIYEKIKESFTPPKDADLKKIVDDSKNEIEILKSSIALDQKLKESNLPERFEKRVRASFDGRVFEAEKLDNEITFWKEEAAKSAEKDDSESVKITMEESDRLQIAMDGMFGVCDDKKDVVPFKGIREAYTHFTGDPEVSGVIRAKEAFLSTTLPYILGTSMHRRLIADYKAKDWGWKKFCSIGSAANFKLQERLRPGYFGDLADINPETHDYDEIAEYGEERATFTVGQKGNIVSVTRKMIVNDDLNVMMKLIGRLGRSAARTLAKMIFVTYLQDNTAALYTVDTDQLIETRTPNNNLHIEALTDSTDILAAIQLFDGMVEPDSGEPLGITVEPGSTVLVVPTELRDEANAINRGTSIETYLPYRNYWGENNEDIVVSPLLTTATYWYLFAKEIETMEVAFLNGREEPEMFLADNPVVGQMFDADKLRYKIRHEYIPVLLDHRGVVSNNAA